MARVDGYPPICHSRAVHVVLDEDRRAGLEEIETVLRPERYARPIDASNMAAFEAEIDRLSQVWGGPTHPIIPVSDGSIDPMYARLLPTAEIDGVREVGDLALPALGRIEISRADDYPTLALLVRGRDAYRQVSVVTLSADDPWAVIYAICLGRWPTTPSEDLLDFVGLPTTLTYDDALPTSFVDVTGSLDDLAARLTDRRVSCPRQFSLSELAAGIEPDSSLLVQQKILPAPRAVQRAAGPNIVVVCSPGNVSDLCLLWNLRGAHPFGYALPIGLPAEAVGQFDATTFREPGRTAYFGLTGGRLYLTSTSVAAEELSTLAERVPGCAVASPDDLVSFGPAPGRPARQAVTWADGETRVAAFGDADLEVLSGPRRLVRQPSMYLAVRIPASPLPLDPTLRGPQLLGPHYYAGSAQLRVQLREPGTVRVIWPTGWTCLRAAAKTRGLDVAESSAGRAALALLRALGGLDQVPWLLDDALLTLLFQAGERAGMGWSRARMRRLSGDLATAGRDDAATAAVLSAAERDVAAVVAGPDEGRALPFVAFKDVLGSATAARRWLSWAVDRRVLVQGAVVVCESCGAPTWVPVRGLAPPIECPGCARSMGRPFDLELLKFSYRLGEPLRRALEQDCVGHLVAMHYFVRILGASVVGAHPGVDIYAIDSGRRTRLGEADVAILLADGNVIPVEVKRSAAGVTSDEVGKLDRLGDAWGSPWTAFAVTQSGRDCADARAFERRLPEAPRLILTNDHVLVDRPVWPLGSDPFGDRNLTDDARAKRADVFRKWLREGRPRDNVEQSTAFY